MGEARCSNLIISAKKLMMLEHGLRRAARVGLRHVKVPVDKLAISPDLKAAADWRRPVDHMPGCYRGFIAVVIDLMHGEHIAC
jgi:hypothetical protein